MQLAVPCAASLSWKHRVNSSARGVAPFRFYGSYFSISSHRPTVACEIWSCSPKHCLMANCKGIFRPHKKPGFTECTYITASVQNFTLETRVHALQKVSKNIRFWYPTGQCRHYYLLEVTRNPELAQLLDIASEIGWHSRSMLEISEAVVYDLRHTC